MPSHIEEYWPFKQLKQLLKNLKKNNFDLKWAIPVCLKENQNKIKSIQIQK
jgi:hypothetical protein